MVAVNEIYGRLTVQGEGLSIGQLCTFVRLARCNLNCGEGEGAKWKCDTPFTWRWASQYEGGYDPNVEVALMDEADIINEVMRLNPPLVVISGGEPFLQQAALTRLVRGFAELAVRVEIETNGTRPPWPELEPALFNVSPKLSNSGILYGMRIKPRALAALLHSGRARFKFVCADEHDLCEVDELCEEIGIPPGLVWVMPAGTSAVQIRQALGRVAEAAIARRYNLTTRLHVELWGNARGV